MGACPLLLALTDGRRFHGYFCQKLPKKPSRFVCIPRGVALSINNNRVACGVSRTRQGNNSCSGVGAVPVDLEAK